MATMDVANYDEICLDTLVFLYQTLIVRPNNTIHFCQCNKAESLSVRFNTVDHKILLAKLEHYGISGVALKWFKSYLNNRTQQVLCNGKLSDFKMIEFGVPQGSILGPLPFLLYINDLSNS